MFSIYSLKFYLTLLIIDIWIFQVIYVTYEVLCRSCSFESQTNLHCCTFCHLSGLCSVHLDLKQQLLQEVALLSAWQLLTLSRLCTHILAMNYWKLLPPTPRSRLRREVHCETWLFVVHSESLDSCSVHFLLYRYRFVVHSESLESCNVYFLLYWYIIVVYSESLESCNAYFSLYWYLIVDSESLESCNGYFLLYRYLIVVHSASFESCNGYFLLYWYLTRR